MGDAEEDVKMVARAIDRYGAQRGYRHGWKSELADALGVHPTYVGKLIACQRRLSRRVFLRLERILDDGETHVPSGRDVVEWALARMGDRERADVVAWIVGRYA